MIDGEQYNSFERMWDSNKEHLRWTLLSLTSDFDLTEDLLQETYLRARTGVSTYRGDGELAWLTAIARNTFYSHARHRGYRSEESLDSVADYPDESSYVDSDCRLSLLAIRDAISTLDRASRGALIMKHYAGWDYDEIGEHLSCSPAMAKHRVWRAMQKVRKAISDAEDGGMRCSELRGARILDWLYGVLTPREVKRIEAHTALCASCRKSLAQIRRLSTALDKCDGDLRLSTLIDLDERGRTTRYVWFRHVNCEADAVRTFHWNRRLGWTVECLALQGEPVQIRWGKVDEDFGLQRFEGDLPTPVPSGGTYGAMFVACPPEGSDWEARPQVDGLWHYHHKHTPFPDDQGLFVITIRLPKDARLLMVDPEPRRLTTRTDRVSLNWEIVTEPMAAGWEKGAVWQFEACVDYELPT